MGEACEPAVFVGCFGSAIGGEYLAKSISKLGISESDRSGLPCSHNRKWFVKRPNLPDFKSDRRSRRIAVRVTVAGVRGRPFARGTERRLLRFAFVVFPEREHSLPLPRADAQLQRRVDIGTSHPPTSRCGGTFVRVPGRIRNVDQRPCHAACA